MKLDEDVVFLTNGIQRAVHGKVIVTRKATSFCICIRHDVYSHIYFYSLPYDNFKEHKLKIIHEIIEEYRYTVMRDFMK